MTKRVTIALVLSQLAAVVVGCGDNSTAVVPRAKQKSPPEIAAPDQPSGHATCCILDEPTRLEDRTTEDWIAELRNGGGDALVDAGEQAAPILLAAMKDPQAATNVVSMLGFRQKEESWTVPILVAGLRSPDRNTRYSALLQLGELGPRVREVAPTIAQELEPLCETDGDEALRVVEKIGLPVEEAPTLVAKLYEAGTSPSSGPGSAFFRKEDIVAKLIGRGPRGVPTLLDLVANAKSDDERDFDLPDCGPEVIDAILAALDDPNVKRRRAAAWLLTRHAGTQRPNPFTEAQLTALWSHLGDRDESVREYLFELLQRQPPQSDEAVTALMTALEDANGINVFRAAHALAAMAPRSLEALRAAAHSEHTQLRLAATVAIGSLTPIPEEDVSRLIHLAADSDVTVRQYALYGLQQTKRGTPDVLHCFTEALNDPETVFWATRGLGEIGPAAAPVLPALLDRLKDTDPNYRVSLALAIWQIDPTSPVVIPVLLEVMKDTKTPQGGYCCITKIVDGRRIEMRSPLREPVAYAAAQTLGTMGAAAAPAVPALVEALDSDNSDLARIAVSALGNIGPAARAAIDPLHKLAASEDPRNADAHFALEEIAPEVAAKIPTDGYRYRKHRLAPVQPAR